MSTMQDRINAAKPTRRRGEVFTWFDALTDIEQQAVRGMLLDADWSHLAIQRFVIAEGIPVGKDTVAKWRVSLGFTGRSY